MKHDNTTLQDFSGNNKLHFTIPTIKIKKNFKWAMFWQLQTHERGLKGERPPRDREKIRFPLVVRAEKC